MKERDYEEKVWNSNSNGTVLYSDSGFCYAEWKGSEPDYVTDLLYDVQSTQGGVDIYDEADTHSVKLNDSKIPNGTAIHVLGEKNGADNKKMGIYTVPWNERICSYG